MLTLIKNSTYLNKLNIIDDRKTLWPSDTVDSTITGLFFDAFSSVPEYRIEVTGKSQVTALMNKWLRAKKQSSREIHLSLKFNGGTSRPISLAIEESNSNPATKLKYEGLTDSEEHNSSIWIDDIISQVEYIDPPSDVIIIRDRIIDLFGEEHVNLKTLILTNCVFTLETFPNTLLPENQHLKRLVLNKCRFSLPVLTSFLALFNLLDFVSLGSCCFKSAIRGEHINMSTTSIGTLRMKLLHWRKILL